MYKRTSAMRMKKFYLSCNRTEANYSTKPPNTKSEDWEKFQKVRNELKKKISEALKRNFTKMFYYQTIVKMFGKLYTGY